MGEVRQGQRHAWQTLWTKRVLRVGLGLMVAALFAALFVWRTDVGELKANLADVNIPILLGATAFYFANVLFQSLRWHFLTKHMGSPGLRKLVPPMVIGIMGNNVLPLRMGIILRTEYVWSRFRLKAPAVLSTIVIEGWLDGVVLAVVFVPTLAIIGTEQGIIRGVVVSGGIAAGGLLLLRIAFSERWSRFWGKRRRVLPRLGLPDAVQARITALLESFLTGLVSVRSGYVLAQALWWTAAAWLVRAAELYLVGLSLNLDQSFADYLVVTAALNASGIIHVSPGNTGPYEFVVAEVLTSLGAARGAASAYAIVSHAVLFIPVTIVGLLLFLWHRLTLPAANVPPFAEESLPPSSTSVRAAPTLDP